MRQISDEVFEDLIGKYCPDDIGLSELSSCNGSDCSKCVDCWDKALKGENKDDN